jgi:hypothetical protein
MIGGVAGVVSGSGYSVGSGRGCPVDAHQVFDDLLPTKASLREVKRDGTKLMAFLVRFKDA